MIRKLFANEPSYTEQTICNNCTHSDSKTFPLVILNETKFSKDFGNLELAVKDIFQKILLCTKCNKEIECKRKLGSHLFIEVTKYYIVRHEHMS